MYIVHCTVYSVQPTYLDYGECDPKPNPNPYLNLYPKPYGIP